MSLEALMNREVVRERLRVLIAEFVNVSPDHVTDDASSETIESWDSLAHMNLMVAIEQEFGIEFDDSEILANRELHALIALIEAKGGN
jgi:acyl carrier protein